MFPTFLEVSLKWSVHFSCCSRVRWLESYPAYLGVSALVYGYDIIMDLYSALVFGSSTFWPLVWWRFLRALDTKVLPDFWGFLKFSEGLLRDCEKLPGKFAS